AGSGGSGSPVPEVQAAAGHAKGMADERLSSRLMPAPRPKPWSLSPGGRNPFGHRQSRTGSEGGATAPPSSPGAPPAGSAPEFEMRARSVQNACNLQLHARAHGRAQAHLLDVAALGAGGLRLGHRAHEGLHVVDQRLLAEARLADAGMDQSRLLGPELDLA